MAVNGYVQLIGSGGREKPGDHTPINDHAEVFSRCGAINEFLGAVLKPLDAHILHVEHEIRSTNRPQPEPTKPCRRQVNKRMP